MLALGTGLKQAEAMFDAVFYSLVIAGFKMQAVELLQAAPVTSIQAPLYHDVVSCGACLNGEVADNSL